MPYHVETFIARIDPIDPDPLPMALAGQVILDGGLVAFPTETVYGLGANALDAAAVGRIFEVKERPANDPVIVHIGELDQMGDVTSEWTQTAKQLAEKFWPGPLTLVVRRGATIPDNVTAGQTTVAVRIPDHPVAQSLIRKAGVPIAAPSANRFSRPSPTNAMHVLADLQGRVDVVLNGGSTRVGVESTIVDLSREVPTVLRPGGISLEELQSVLPQIAYRPRHITDDAVAPAPGTLAKHYSPNAEVLVYEGEREVVLKKMRETAEAYLQQGQRVGILAQDKDVNAFAELTAQIVLLGTTPDEIATHLFAGIRSLDTSDVDVMLVRAPEQTGLGLAVYDRLSRAAEGRIIRV